MKKLSYLIVLALILGLSLAGCTLLSNIGQVPTTEQSGITCLMERIVEETLTQLIAGQNIEVGTVSVWNDGSNLYVRYETIDDWKMTETHLAVADLLDKIPQTKKGNPIPGKFEHSMEHDPSVTEYTYTIPLVWDYGEELFIAAHAVVVSDSIIFQKETAWGSGDPFPGKNWATFFYYTVDKPPPPVFIPGTVYSNIEHFLASALAWNNTAPESYPFENQVLVPFKTGPEGDWELHSIRLWGALGTANIRIYEDGHPIEIVEVTYGNVVKATWISDGISPLYEWQFDSIEWVVQDEVELLGYPRTNKMYTLPTPVILDADTTYWLGIEPPSTPVKAGFSCYMTESTYNPAGYDLTSFVMELLGGYWQ
ncbi:hypothetical protein ES708_24366 [subsurface metagenome]